VRPSVLYRIATVLLIIFAIAHTTGFRQSDPAWGAQAVVASMQSVHFDVQGFNRTYWDFFVAGGLGVDLFFVFAATVSWQLGTLPPATLASLRLVAWALALVMAAMTALCWTYLFYPPLILSALLTVCLAAAAWRSTKPHVAG
jgi:hypothetical protein